MPADIWGLIGNGSLSVAAHYVVNWSNRILMIAVL